MRRTSETDSKSTLSQSHSWIIQLLSCSVKLPPSSSSSSSSSCLLTGCDRGLARSSGTSFTLINVSSSCEHIYSFMLLCLSSLYYIHSSSAYQSPPPTPRLQAHSSPYHPLLCLVSIQAYRIIIHTRFTSLHYSSMFFPQLLPKIFSLSIRKKHSILSCLNNVRNKATVQMCSIIQVLMGVILFHIITVFPKRSTDGKSVQYFILTIV